MMIWENGVLFVEFECFFKGVCCSVVDVDIELFWLEWLWMGMFDDNWCYYWELMELFWCIDFVFDLLVGDIGLLCEVEWFLFVLVDL